MQFEGRERAGQVGPVVPFERLRGRAGPAVGLPAETGHLLPDLRDLAGHCGLDGMHHLVHGPSPARDPPAAFGQQPVERLGPVRSECRGRERASACGDGARTQPGFAGEHARVTADETADVGGQQGGGHGVERGLPVPVGQCGELHPPEVGQILFGSQQLPGRVSQGAEPALPREYRPRRTTTDLR